MIVLCIPIRFAFQLDINKCYSIQCAKCVICMITNNSDCILIFTLIVFLYIFIILCIPIDCIKYKYTSNTVLVIFYLCS